MNFYQIILKQNKFNKMYKYNKENKQNQIQKNKR